MASYPELMIEKNGVTVTVLCPGPTKTEFFERNDMARFLHIGLLIVMFKSRINMVIGNDI